MSEDSLVQVIGTGLIGTSAGLALRGQGITVYLADRDAGAAAHAQQRGAGNIGDPPREPDVVIVAVPPASVAAEMAAALKRYPNATVTDVASVKGRPLAQLRELGADLSRVVGGHPMAGREVSGPGGARADLFEDRFWVLTPTEDSDPGRVAEVADLARAAGALVVQLPPGEHDRAVALTSHTPQVLASLLAARLEHAAQEDVSVSGQGLRDTTRIAGSDPALWSQILAANAGQVASVLEAVSADLSELTSALRTLDDDPGDVAAAARVSQILIRGTHGRSRVPAKHGGIAAQYTAIPVVIDDRPGELARLFGAAGDAGVNLEDVRIEHTAGRQSAIVELAVEPGAAGGLRAALAAGGWHLRG